MKKVNRDKITIISVFEKNQKAIYIINFNISSASSFFNLTIKSGFLSYLSN